VRINLCHHRISADARVMEPPNQTLEDARRAGIDLDLLDTNLALSVKERWQQHDNALDLAMKLEAAGRVRDAKLQSIATTSL
jgi:hypothetical protein